MLWIHGMLQIFIRDGKQMQSEQTWIQKGFLSLPPLSMSTVISIRLPGFVTPMDFWVGRLG
jgi:hypothetical protein